MTVEIEIIAAPGCQKCARAREELRAAAVSVLGEGGLVWREVNPLRDVERTVALGVLSMPAIAIDGVLQFTTLPSPARFRAALTRLVSD